MKELADASTIRAERTRRKQERDVLDAIFKMVPDAIISVDLEGRIRMFNPAAERIFGHSRASVQGQPVEMLIPERMRAGHHDAQQRFANSGGETRMMGLRRVKGLRADGQEIELEGSIALVKLPEGYWSLVTLQDVTERVQTEARLQHSRTQLAELAKKLMTQERVLVRRVAQLLHDQLGQTLAAIRMCHDTIGTLPLTGMPSGYGPLQQRMGTLIEQAIAEVRRVLVDLRPPLLEAQGLGVALDNELRNRARAAPHVDISIQVPSRLELMRWPAEVEYAAFMVVREAVENALRHARASEIWVDMNGDAMQLHLTVSDNGIGLPAQSGASVVFGSADDTGAQVSFHWQGLS